MKLFASIVPSFLFTPSHVFLFHSSQIYNMTPAIASRDTAGPSTVGWVSDPDGRGTFSLVTSCLLTLGLCVWSALHLNIPSKDEGRRKYWLRRVKWSVCGILIPEIVVLLAWRQWTSAGRLTNEINKVLNDVEQRSTSSHASSKSNLRDAQVNILPVSSSPNADFS